jgi:hypothetical protein
MEYTEYANDHKEANMRVQEKRVEPAGLVDELYKYGTQRQQAWHGVQAQQTLYSSRCTYHRRSGQSDNTIMAAIMANSMLQKRHMDSDKAATQIPCKTITKGVRMITIKLQTFLRELEREIIHSSEHHVSVIVVVAAVPIMVAALLAKPFARASLADIPIRQAVEPAGDKRQQRNHLMPEKSPGGKRNFAAKTQTTHDHHLLILPHQRGPLAVGSSVATFVRSLDSCQINKLRLLPLKRQPEKKRQKRNARDEEH